jgi:threonine/homoserine/homoserine lactone efflux protein
MSLTSAVLSFAILAGLLTIVPGLDTALVLRAAISQGRREAFATALGICTGALVWGAGAAVGVSVLLTASTTAYTAVRIAGAAYMVWLGGTLLLAAVRRQGRDASRSAPAAAATAWQCWRRGLLTNLLNPKIGAFYVAVLPQFIPPDSSHLAVGLLLALVHDIEGMLWFTGLILGAQWARRWLGRRGTQRAVDSLTGTALLGFGVKLGLSSR